MKILERDNIIRFLHRLRAEHNYISYRLEDDKITLRLIKTSVKKSLTCL